MRRGEMKMRGGKVGKKDNKGERNDEGTNGERRGTKGKGLEKAWREVMRKKMGGKT